MSSGPCCDDRITAFTGETAFEGVLNLGCPAEPDDFPTCFVTAGCICAYRHPTGQPFVANGNYVGTGFGTSFLSYDGHAGYDFAYASGTPLVALADGMLCTRSAGRRRAAQCDSAIACPTRAMR